MFTPLDWLVVLAYLAGTTVLAARLAARKQSVRDFFLGGRRLSWPLVAGSIVASEVSGVTFVAVPALAWKEDGNYQYLMLAVGALAGRIIIALWLVPAYYRREIYSPYEFMGQALGPAAERIASWLFLLGGFLAQGARLFLAGLVLDNVSDLGVEASILVIGAVSVVWTWIGGIASVVWTDVVQFFILFGGALAVLVCVLYAVPGGAAEVASAGDAASKFAVWNSSTDITKQYTIWCGLFGATFLTLASHGTDQMMAQRLFCCRDAGAAQNAVLASSIGLVLPVIMLTVGVGLYVYFQHFPFAAADAAKVGERAEHVLPVFIRTALPEGVRGLLIAAIFSAATATSTLAAMAQTALSSIYLPLRPHATEPQRLRAARTFVAVAAALLCAVAILCGRIEHHKSLIDLALMMAAYTYGALLGMLLLALRPGRRDARGLLWGVPCAILLVVAFEWQQIEWVRWSIAGAIALFAGAGAIALWREPVRLAFVLAGAGIVLAVAFTDTNGPALAGGYLKIAFPWLYPLGTGITYACGRFLGRPLPPSAAAPALPAHTA
ncbi:MAG: hypothetical protein L0Z55_05065 [Planctomycetes bacterium]|nr:hypothetical protein [Planctomycetota bacterium]